MPAEKVFELISPTSDLGVDLFKADLMNDDCRLTNFSVGVLAFISDINGVVKSANVKMSIANVLKLFTGPFMKTFLEGFTENYETETRNLLCGHVERIRIEGLDCFVFVKLQFWCGEENKLFIWTLTKANIIPSTADDCEIVFPILGEIGLFSFSKLSFSFGIDTACKLVNFPADLNKYLPLLKCETNSLSDLFDIDSSLLSEALNTKRQPQILNYMDSFDALPETGCYKEDPIFTSVAKLKSGSSLFSIKIFQSVIHKNSGTVFPVSMTYDDHEALRSDSVKDFPDDINVSSKFQFIRLSSQSDHSIVYLARNELGQVVIVKKSLHPNSLEANFYQFVLSNSDRCSYIECPLIIDQEERLLVFDYHENRMDLFNFVETKRQLSDSEVKNIFLQICIAVKFLHSNNIVHRDIKVNQLKLRAYLHLIAGKCFNRRGYLRYKINRLWYRNIHSK